MPDIKNLERAKFKDAKTADVVDNIKDPVGTVKHDGAAFFLHITRKDTPEYISRRLSVKGHHLDRTPKLPHLADFAAPEFRGATFHVELIHTGKDKDGVDNHAHLSGILNSLAPKAIETQKNTGPVRAVLLDVTNPKLPTFQDKLDYMKKFQETVGKPDLLYLPETKIGSKDIKQLSKDTKEKGLEGIIITSLSHPEESNVRHKVKHVDTYNLRVSKVTQLVDKNGTPKPMVGALVVEDSTGKEVANVGTGISREQRMEWWRNPHKIVKSLINVKAMPSTARRLRAPVYNGEADGEIDKV